MNQSMGHQSDGGIVDSGKRGDLPDGVTGARAENGDCTFVRRGHIRDAF